MVGAPSPPPCYPGQHRRPQQGSPAVSWRSSSASCSVSSGFFLPRHAPAARLADTSVSKSPRSNCLRPWPRWRGHAEPARRPARHRRVRGGGTPSQRISRRWRSSSRPTSVPVARRICSLPPSGAGPPPSRQHHPPRPQLPAAARRRAGKIQETAVELVPLQTAGADQLAQRVLHVDLHDAAQLGGEASCGCLLHQRLGGSEQGADG